MLKRLSSPVKVVLSLVIGLLLVGVVIAKAQTASPSPSAGPSPSPSASVSPSPAASPSASPSPTPDTTGTLAAAFDSYWYKVVVSVIFGFLVIGFGYVIMRAIRFSKFTFNNPLGLPDGSLRAVLAFLLVSFLGFYVFASVMRGTPFDIPQSLLGIIATVIGFYFGSRTAAPSPERNGSIEGTVVDKNGSPAVGATVTLSQSGKEKQTQTADLNGKFKFDNVPTGDYDIQAALADQTPSDPAKVKVTSGSSQTVTLKLK